MMWWNMFIAKRFLTQRNRRGEGMITLLPIVGIALGIITLVTVIGIMNGFQLGFIENILEVYSYHGQIPVDHGEENELSSVLGNAPSVKSFTFFKESFSLFKGESGRIEGASVRGIDFTMARNDPGFVEHVQIVYGDFPITDSDSIIIGSHLARRLGVVPGDDLTITGTGQSRDASLVVPIQRRFTVSGVFETGYYQYDSTLAFIPLLSFNSLFPGILDVICGLKFDSPQKVQQFAHWWDGNGIEGKAVRTWNELNTSFFSALAVEKLLMIFVISLIFLVVSINLYHSIRRSILSRKEDLSTLKAIGAQTKHLRSIIMLEGSIIGLSGSAIGAPLSLLFVININHVFSCIERCIFLLATAVNQLLPAVQFSPGMLFFSSYPVRVLPHEYILSIAFGLAAPVIGAYVASKEVIGLYPVEVLHYE